MTIIIFGAVQSVLL
ncbi:hypothetical protein LINPERPRIM_LOCUS33182 [Linum perenne]